MDERKKILLTTAAALFLIVYSARFAQAGTVASKNLKVEAFREALRTQGEATEKWHTLDSQIGFSIFDPEYKSLVADALKSGTSRMILGALNVPVGEMEHPEEYNGILLQLLDKKDSAAVRAAAAFALAQSEPDPKFAIPRLASILHGDPDRRVREAAAFALLSIGPDRRALPALKKALEDSGETPINAALALAKLGRNGTDAAPELKKKLQDKNEFMRLSSAHALTAIGEDAEIAVTTLTTLLKSQDSMVRKRAAEYLQYAGPQARPATEVLRETLGTESSVAVRFAVVGAFHAIGAGAKNAVGDLVKVLLNQHEDVNVRVRAAAALIEIEPSKQTVAALSHALKSDDPRVRQAAVKALKETGQRAADAVGALARASTEDADVVVRVEALGILASVNPADENAIGAFSHALTKDKEQGVRLVAARALQTNLAAIKGSASAIDALEKALTDPDDPLIQRVAALCLIQSGTEGRARQAAVNSLKQNLLSKDLLTALESGWILAEGRALDPSGPVIARIREALNNPDKELRSIAVETLGKIGATAAITDLLTVLKKEPDWDVRASAAKALGAFGSSSLPILQQLLVELNNTDKNLRLRAADHSLILLEALAAHVSNLSIPELERLVAAPSKVKDALGVPSAEVVSRVTDVTSAFESALKTKQQSLRYRGWRLAVEYPLIAVFLLYLALALLVCLTIFIFRPLWLVRISDALRPYALFTFPDGILAGLSVDLRLLLLVRFFEYRPRTLDAWVAANMQTARDAFKSGTTVDDRKVHIDLPAVVDGHNVTAFAGEHLRRTFNKQRSCLLIVGEGGSGKTSLACHIANLAISDDEQLRPCKHVMLPVLIEQELTLSTAGKHPFLDAVRGQLQALTGTAEPISEDLLNHLLRRRRVLVIVDHFSEMTEATRKHIRPGDPRFSVNALIVTSRIEEPLDNVPRTVVKPLRIEGNRLSSFMEAYLTECGNRDLFDDPEYFDLCRRLSIMVGERNITVLLAKLYAEQVIALKRKEVTGQLPENVPDLMLSYLNQLNHDVTDERIDDRILHRDAKIVAWECLRHSYRPQAASQEAVIAAMGGNGAETRLKYLEKRLRLIETITPAKDRVRYTLDPLAEYLASLYLIDTCRDDEQAWRDFLVKAKHVYKDSTLIKGFLAAVRDSCNIKGKERNVPSFVGQELAALA